MTDEPTAVGLVAAVVQEHFLKNYSALDSLQFALECLGKDLSGLEKTHGHDDAIPAEKWHEAGEAFYTWAMPLSELLDHMSDSLKVLRAAHKKIKGRYRGELKDKSEERLTRHLSTGESLLEGLRELKSAQFAPPRLFEYRYRSLVELLQDYSEFVDKVVDMRRILKESSFTRSLLAPLSEQTEALLQLRAALQKLRDNPRQNMAGVLSKHGAQLQKIRKDWERVHGDIQRRNERLHRRAAE
jgi:hypothetical protein